MYQRSIQSHRTSAGSRWGSSTTQQQQLQHNMLLRRATVAKSAVVEGARTSKKQLNFPFTRIQVNWAEILHIGQLQMCATVWCCHLVAATGWLWHRKIAVVVAVRAAAIDYICSNPVRSMQHITYCPLSLSPHTPTGPARNEAVADAQRHRPKHWGCADHG